MSIFRWAFWLCAFGWWVAVPLVVEAGTKEGLRYLKQGRKHEMRDEFTESLADYGKAIEANPELEEAWYLRGMLHFGTDSLEEARNDLTRVVGAQPGE